MDNSADTVLFKEDLLNIARTTLSSKLLNVEKDHFAALAVDAVLRLKGSGNLDHIQVQYIYMSHFRSGLHRLKFSFGRQSVRFVLYQQSLNLMNVHVLYCRLSGSPERV